MVPTQGSVHSGPRASSRCLERVASLFSAGVNSGRRPEAIAAENGEATLLGTPVSRYKEVVLFVIKDFTGCVTLIGSTTPEPEVGLGHVAQ